MSRSCRDRIVKRELGNQLAEFIDRSTVHPPYDRTVRFRNQLLGPDARPVALPPSGYDQAKVRSHGSVVLPIHIRWSEPAVSYDLDDPADARRVYEQVLREGSAYDIQEFIDVDRLSQMWEDLVLPATVRRRWAFWLRDNRHIIVRC